MNKGEVILELKNITKTFPGVKALSDVSVAFKAGTVHTMMGENGAGKSTLMNCTFGLYQPDSGEIWIEGKKAELKNTRQAMDHGIVMIHQELKMISVRSVMENIWVGRVPYKRVLGLRWVDEKKMYDDTKALFERLGLDIDPRAAAGEYSVSMCQMIEIARAVSYGAKVIIMDEPTSSLTDNEIDVLFKLVGQLVEQNVAVVFISHKIDEIMRISDEVTIMRDGGVVGTWPISELTPQLMVSRMVGRNMDEQFPPHAHTPGQVYLEAEGLSSADPHSFKDVSFELKRSEVLGVGGLVGSQRTELMESLFGLRPLACGEVKIGGRKVNITCPRDAIKSGMAMLTEERRATGIIPMHSITENTVLANQNKNSRYYTGKGLFINEKQRRGDAQHYVDALSIKTPSLGTQIQYLSGGNQQKVLLGRGMLTEPDILILDEPTRGIDVGAKYEIYCLIEQLAASGKCVIMISSYLPELLGVSDRIMVMCEGRCSGVLDAAGASEESIMHLACVNNGEVKDA